MLSTTALRVEDPQWIRDNSESFDRVGAALLGGDSDWPSEGLHSRLLDAVEDMRRDKAAIADVASLIGAVLRRASAQGHANPSLQIRADGLWPTPEQWRRFGIDANSGPETTQLWGRHWSPAWLSGGSAPTR